MTKTKFIVADRYEEFVEWCHNNSIRPWDHSKVKFIPEHYGTLALLGSKSPDVSFVGKCEKRTDINIIKGLIYDRTSC